MSPKKYKTIVISPRSYFVFTPLLAGSTVGSQEFRTILEPVRNRRYPNVEFVQAWADTVDFEKKTVRVEESLVDAGRGIPLGVETEVLGVPSRGTKRTWDVKYDKLVLAVGSYNQIFGTKGVRENAFFLKDVGDARRLRKRILECFEIASLPTTSEEVKRQILHFAIVGGGPTGMELSAELNDLVHEDMAKVYPNLSPFVKVTVYDVASQVLSMFDKTLSDYATRSFRRQNISIRTEHHVEELRRGLPSRVDGSHVDINDAERCFTLKTKENGEVGVGICVWSTGNMVNPFVNRLLEKNHSTAGLRDILGDDSSTLLSQPFWSISKSPRRGGILVDDHLRVQIQASAQTTHPSTSGIVPTITLQDVFALGDNAELSTAALPAAAQVANQQALWLGKRLNRGDLSRETFTYRNLGIMAYIGGARGLFQSAGHTTIKGRSAWLLWRGAYVSMAISWRNKVLIPIYW